MRRSRRSMVPSSGSPRPRRPRQQAAVNQAAIRGAICRPFLCRVCRTVQQFTCGSWTAPRISARQLRWWFRNGHADVTVTIDEVSKAPIRTGQIISDAPVSQSITSISLSSSSFTAGASNAIVGTISVAMSPASPAFSGTFSLSSAQGGCNSTNAANNARFRVVGTTLETNGSLPRLSG
jgi:hypothetical protein